MTINLNSLRTLLHGNSLKSSALRGLAWTSVGVAGAQLMRMASNLLMTRLLAPEHFGVMAIVWAVMTGLAMFSDIGLGPGIVRSSRFQDEDLLNTGWTLQMLRGLILLLACCAAALPIAGFYAEPSLALLLPAAGLTLLIASLAPMQVYTLQRRMAFGLLVKIELGAQAVALVTMLCAGVVFRSIWVLVLGAVVAALVKTVAQWRLLPVHRHRLAWLRSDVEELARFGGWIFVSTLLTFGAFSGGSLLLGKLASMEKVGLFAIASTLAKAAEQFYDQLSHKVLYPVYANLHANPDGEHRQRIFKIRVAITATFVPAMCAAAYCAQPIFRTLFDPRYAGAAWIFQAVLMGLVPSIISSTLPYLVARGSSVLAAGFSAARLIGFVVLAAIGYQLGGEDGAILGIAFVPSLLYLVAYGIQRAYRLSDFRIDAVALLVWMTTGLLIWRSYV